MTKQKYKQSNVLVWFLDGDLNKSAEYLTNIALEKTIDGCFASMVTSMLYFIGIRNKKAYEYYFSQDMRDLTIEKFFSGWPFRNKPAFRYYSHRVVKWTRMCREHFNYMKTYFDILINEHEARLNRRHKLAAFSEWVDSELAVRIPEGHIKQVVPPWKNVKLKFRRKDIIEGYRLQYMDTFLWGDPIAAYASSNRDVPDFVISHFHLDTASFIT